MTAKCSSCGATVSSRDEICSYCGSDNPNYSPPDNEVNILLEKAMSAYQQEHYAVAIDCYNQAITLDPEVFGAYFYLAAALTIIGRHEEAIKAMEKAQALRPGNTAVYYNLGVLCKKIGRKAEARTYLEKALELVKKDSAVQNQGQLRKSIEKELVEFKRWKLF